jgi:hypothetical protein
MILLCNHKRTKFEKPYAYREPMCASENCQWCEEPYFAVAEISIRDILPQFTARASISQKEVSLPHPVCTPSTLPLLEFDESDKLS